MLARYNDNAYKVDIPRDKYNVSDIFNVKEQDPNTAQSGRYYRL